MQIGLGLANARDGLTQDENRRSPTSSPGYPKVQSYSLLFLSVVRPPLSETSAPPLKNNIRNTFETHSSSWTGASGPATTWHTRANSLDLSTRNCKQFKSTTKSSIDIRIFAIWAESPNKLSLLADIVVPRWGGGSLISWELLMLEMVMTWLDFFLFSFTTSLTNPDGHLLQTRGGGRRWGLIDD